MRYCTVGRPFRMVVVVLMVRRRRGWLPFGLAGLIGLDVLLVLPVLLLGVSAPVPVPAVHTGAVCSSLEWKRKSSTRTRREESRPCERNIKVIRQILGPRVSIF
jgi:hypothetical protein